MIFWYKGSTLTKEDATSINPLKDSAILNVSGSTNLPLITLIGKKVSLPKLLVFKN